MRWAVQFELSFLAVGLCCLQVQAAPDPSASDYEKSPPERSSYDREMFQRIAREQQDRYRKRVAIPADALVESSQVAGFKGSAGTRTGIATGPKSAGISRKNLLLASLCLLAWILAFLKYAPQVVALINAKWNPWALPPSAAARFASRVRAEEQAFSEFVAAFRVGQTAAPRPSTVTLCAPVRKVPGEAAEPGFRMEKKPVENFCASAPELLTSSQRLLEEIGWTLNTPARQIKLGELLSHMGALKSQAGIPELLPAWQMACALEGLIKQLTAKASFVTASTLRTIGISLDLLNDLCVKGLKADLATNPPIRLLAVDDDPVTRRALSWSLNKALSQPDLAENGEAALALVTRQPYDVIFLDVQMPGMDGFELCSRIHDTATNRITPVVFVTCQSDFNVRVESTRCGGIDLIGKPFLTFEITVMALTLALRRRLQARHPATAAADETIAADLLLPPVRRTPAAEVASAPAAPPAFASTEPFTRLESHVEEVREEEAASTIMRGNASCDNLVPAGGSDSPEPHADTVSALSATGETAPMPSQPATNELAHAFFTQAPAHVGELRKLIRVISQAEDEHVRQEMLLELYLFAHSLTLNAELAELQPAFRMSAALEGLLKKLIETPGRATASTLQTAAAALDLLQDLCVRGLNPDMATHPPIHMLAVDDDPIACRALGGALQTAFEKSDLAENGETALRLATQRSYDVIFLDVIMPDMDGFTLCPKIHETAANRHTPVVFVTSHSDVKLPSQSTASGDTNLITKPFLTAEITVKALTCALRHRLQKFKTAQQPMPQPVERERVES